MNTIWPIVYAVQHKNDDIRAASRSGGIFTAISDIVLNDDGIIYGCIFDEKFKAVHFRADNIDDRNKMRGSKYIQSDLGDTFRSVKDDLQGGKKVLFSGTSCQVAGLKNFLGKKYENLICVDIVCHGVPSPKIWGEYLKWQEKRNKSKIQSVIVRNKKDFGWRASIETLVFENGKKVNSQLFYDLFYGHNILRPSCYECPYKTIMHPGDITIADYWGIETAAPEFDDDKGVSLVLINNGVGKKYFEKVKEAVRWKTTKIEDSMQPPLKAPYPKPKERIKFWKDFNSKGFNYIIKKYTGYGCLNKAKRFIRKVKRKLVG